MRRVLLLVVFVIAVVATRPIVSGAQAVPRQVGGVGITVFADANFRGANATLRNDTPDLRRVNLNDAISSLRVAPGEMWEGCVDINYRGRCQVFSGSEPDLHRREWGDTISSIRRVRSPGGGGGALPRPPLRSQIILYDRTSFRGTSRTLTTAMAGLTDFNNRAASVRVVRGSWELCAGARWTGRCVTVDENVTDLNRLGMRGQVTSVRPR